MNGVDVLDDYLGELLLDATLPAPAVAPVAVAEAVPVTPPAAPIEVEAAPPPPAPPTAEVAPVAPAMPAPAPAPPRPRVEARPAPAVAEAAPPRPAAPATMPPPPVPTPAGNNVWAALQAQAREAHQPQHQQRRASERVSRWLRLRCGTQAYALELLKVQEVVLPVPLLGLRGTATSVLGIMNLRGQVVPVIDLGLHLGFAPTGEDSLTRIVVLEEKGEALGLRVSAVEDVASLTESQIEPPDTARICQISNTLFRGVARIGQQPMILLDASELLQCER